MKQPYVSTLIEQDFDESEKELARDNIGAGDGKISWVKYNPGSPTPVVHRSDLAVVTSEQGTRIQNSDASEKFYVAPNFSTPDDTGKVFTIGTDGAAKWKPIPTPKKDLFLQIFKEDLQNISSNISKLKTISIPEGTTKIDGSINCYPRSGFESLSIVPLKADGREYETKNNLNFNHLLALDESEQSLSGQYSNTLNFKFTRKDVEADGAWHSLAIKGQSGSGSTDYNVRNIQITFIKESRDG